jgi:hypothetical protein
MKIILIAASSIPSNFTNTFYYYSVLYFILFIVLYKTNDADTVIHLVPPSSGHFWNYQCHFNHFCHLYWSHVLYFHDLKYQCVQSVTTTVVPRLHSCNL